METHLLYELLGYGSSVLIALSVMMRSMVKLRLINVIGSIGYVTYGLLIGAYPVAALNLVILLINLFYLRSYFGGFIPSRKLASR
jgi:hypothetical protein